LKKSFKIALEYKAFDYYFVKYMLHELKFYTAGNIFLSRIIQINFQQFFISKQTAALQTLMM
jgi:hypothetical protein